MTPSQLTQLKTYIDSQPDLASEPNNDDGHYGIAVKLNQPATPTFFLWKSSVAVTELMLGGFDWTRVDNLTVGKARIWEWMTSIGVVDPSEANIRAGFEACFSVEAGDAPNRQAIYNNSVRPGTRFEVIYATGTGTAPSNHGVGPGTAVLLSPVSPNDVQRARNPQ